MTALSQGLRAAWLTGTCALLLACHGQRPGGTLGGALGAAPGVAPSTAPGRTLPPPAAAARYDSAAPSGSAISGPDGDAVASALVGASSAHAMQVAPDARLMQLAAWIAEQVQASQATPPQSATDFATRSLGLVEPTPHFIVIATNDASVLPSRLLDEVNSLYARHAYTHYGASTQLRDGMHLVVIALSFRFIDMQPVPRGVSTGTALPLKGTLTHGHVNPELAVTRPDGQVERQHPGAGAKFASRMETAAPGIYRVEVLAQGPQGIAVVANFPVYAGVPIPERIDIAPAPSSPTTPGTENETVLAMLNAERTRAGLAKLTLDLPLSAVARAHVDDMLAHGFIGHTSPTTGSAVDRVARAGIRTPLVLENIGRGYSLQEVHDGLMSSPGHRANILHPQATHVGIAVGTERDHTATAFVVTQVFRRVTPALQGDAAGALLLRINALRAQRGVGALQDDHALQAIAARGARLYCSATAPKEADVMQQVHGELARTKAHARRVSAMLTIVAGLEDLPKLDALLAPGLHGLGVGLAQGARPDNFPNAICAVLLLSE